MFAIVIVIVGHRSWPCLPVWMPRSAAFRHFDIETLNHNFVKDTRHAGPDSRDTYIHIHKWQKPSEYSKNPIQITKNQKAAKRNHEARRHENDISTRRIPNDRILLLAKFQFPR